MREEDAGGLILLLPNAQLASQKPPEGVFFSLPNSDGDRQGGSSLLSFRAAGGPEDQSLPHMGRIRFAGVCGGGCPYSQ
jgi:hypothetical protein